MHLFQLDRPDPADTSVAGQPILQGLSGTPPVLPRFRLVEAGQPGRDDAENFVADRFRQAYQATLHEYLPWLLTMECGRSLSAVVGVAIASAGPLFLEQYLDQPIESKLHSPAQTPPNRGAIVEIGNLVTVGNGASLALFIVLASAAALAGQQYLVFTATESLRKRFSRLGLKVIDLAEADPARLNSTSVSEWGSYYAHKPRVAAIRVREAVDLIAGRHLFATLHALLGHEIEPLGHRLRKLKLLP